MVALVLLLLVALILRERYENYEEALKDVGQTAGYITPKCDTGYTINSDQSLCEMAKPDGTKETKTPTCPSGSFVVRGTRGLCENTGASLSPDTTTTPTRGRDRDVQRPTGGTMTGVPTGSVGGGSSGNLLAPTSGTVTPSKVVWGPIFSGQGSDLGQTGGDSTKSNTYPELLGGFAGSRSGGSMVGGVGITRPSQPGLWSGSGAGAGGGGTLPSSQSLGTDLDSQFLPFSRQPGDMDLVPDPYRLARNFSASNLSSTRDPIPFLTDFSAFYK